MPAIFGPWAREVVDRAAPRAGEQVLDVACGTGPGARIAAARVTSTGRVVGVDIDTAMLAVAESLTERDGARIEWKPGSALDLPFEDETFDVVFCCQGLQFFPGKDTALREMRRVLKSGGRLAVSVWRSVEYCPGHFAVARAMANQSDTKPAAMPPFSLSDAGELDALAVGAKFTDVKIEKVVRISRFRSTKDFVERLAAGAPSTRHALAKFDADARRSIVRAVCNSLQHYEDSEGLALPMESHILTARA